MFRLLSKFKGWTRNEKEWTNTFHQITLSFQPAIPAILDKYYSSIEYANLSTHSLFSHSLDIFLSWSHIWSNPGLSNIIKNPPSTHSFFFQKLLSFQYSNSIDDTSNSTREEWNGSNSYKQRNHRSILQTGMGRVLPSILYIFCGRLSCGCHLCLRLHG